MGKKDEKRHGTSLLEKAFVHWLNSTAVEDLLMPFWQICFLAGQYSAFTLPLPPQRLGLKIRCANMLNGGGTTAQLARLHIVEPTNMALVWIARSKRNPAEC